MIISIMLKVFITLMYVQVFLLSVMIVSLQLGLREFRQDFDIVAPPHNHYCADSGSK